MQFMAVLLRPVAEMFVEERVAVLMLVVEMLVASKLVP